MIDRISSNIFLLLLIFCLGNCNRSPRVLNSLYSTTEPIQATVRWCAPHHEYIQCLRFLNDTLKDSSLTNGRIRVGDDSQTGTSKAYSILLTCIYANHIFECADLIAHDKADVSRYSAEQLFGLSTSSSQRFMSLAPLAVGATAKNQYVREYSTIVVKSNSGISSINQLKDRKACFGNVTHTNNFGYTASWIMPVQTLQSKWIPQTSRRFNCSTDYQIVNDVFGAGSCAPGYWAQDSVFSPQFTNRMCAACAGKGSDCTSSIAANDPLVCLSTGRGDVAFVSSQQITRDFMASTPKYTKSEYQLLCLKDSTSDITDFEKCHFGSIPEDAYIGQAIPSRTSPEPSIIGKYVSSLFSVAQHSKYPSLPFLADDQVLYVQRIDQVMPGYVGMPPIKDYLEKFGNEVFLPAMKSSFPSCSFDSIRLCVDSIEEQDKCQEMQLAFQAAGLPTTLTCLVSYSEDSCVQMLNSSTADLTMISSHRADSYVQSQMIRPILKETYLIYDYAIAVTSAQGKTLNNFQQLGQVCSSGTDSFAGWEAPNMVLQQLGIIPKTCKLTEEWNRLITAGSCIPGSNNASVTLGRGSQFPIDQNGALYLCKNCGNTGEGTCKTPAEASGKYHELFDHYYGDVGALRCLSRRNGNLAFVRSSAISTINTLRAFGDPSFANVDFNTWTILCKDGVSGKPFNVASVNDCNLGRVPEKWMVARNTDNLQLQRWQDAWMIAYGRARSDFDWLKTYVPYSLNMSAHMLDLIFSNNTQMLTRLDFVGTSLQQFHSMAYNDPNYQNPFVCLTSKSAVLSGSFFSFLLFLFTLCYIV